MANFQYRPSQKVKRVTLAEAVEKYRKKKQEKKQSEEKPAEEL